MPKSPKCTKTLINHIAIWKYSILLLAVTKQEKHQKDSGSERKTFHPSCDNQILYKFLILPQKYFFELSSSSKSLFLDSFSFYFVHSWDETFLIFFNFREEAKLIKENVSFQIEAKWFLNWEYFIFRGRLEDTRKKIRRW